MVHLNTSDINIFSPSHKKRKCGNNTDDDFMNTIMVYFIRFTNYILI